MKKHKFDINKFRDIFVKEMAPTYEHWIFLACLFLYSLLTDLGTVFNFDLKFTLKLLDILGTLNLVYCIAWFVCLIVYNVLSFINVSRYKKDHPTGEEHLPYED